MVFVARDAIAYSPIWSEGLARFTPSPHHTDADIEHLVQALVEIWADVGLAKAA